MNFKRILIFIILFLFSCSHNSYTPQKSVSSRSIAQLDQINIAGSNLSMLGASNTTGFGTSLSFDLRIRNHWENLSKSNFDLVKELEDKSILIALDYFYPSNFPELNNETVDHAAKVESIIQDWSHEYDIVIVVSLPSLDEINQVDGLADYLKKSEAKQLKSIVETLSSEKTKLAVNKVNSKIYEMDQNHSSVFSVSATELFQLFYEDSKKWPWQRSIKPSRLFLDDLHFNDKGQAVVYNEFLLPKIGEALNIDVSKAKMPVANVHKRTVKDLITKIVCNADHFNLSEKCSYWIAPESDNAFKSQNAKIHLPSSYSMSGTEMTRIASQKNIMLKEMESISDLEKKRRVAELMGISELIHKNGSQEGFLLKVAHGEKLILDLTKVLFYSLFPVYLDSDNQSFENWGYDHWLSYRYLYTGDFSLESRIVRAASMSSPGTNYYIRLEQDDKNPKKFIMTWRIYATIEGQKDEETRLDFIPSEYKDHLIQHQTEYPYIEYQIPLVVKKL